MKMDFNKIPGYTKVAVSSFVRMKLKTDAVWAKRACLAVYTQQTTKEKLKHISEEHNGVGFTRYDAPLLSDIAGRLRRGTSVLEDVEILKLRMSKYFAQVINLSDMDKLTKCLDSYYHRLVLAPPFGQQPTAFAEVSWTPADVRTLPGGQQMRDVDAINWLKANESRIRDKMLDLGYVVLEMLLRTNKNN